MKHTQLRQMRDRLGLSQTELANTLNEALGRRYTSASISGWELGKKPLPEHVSVFLDAIALDTAMPSSDPPNLSPEDPAAGVRPEDSPPAPDGAPERVPLSSSGAYKKACTELWAIVASGVGMAGAATGNQKLMADGQIIDADKDALGEAWGKLAETNETFRNMLIGMTSGGAWLQVALVTGTTVGRVWQNHAYTGESYGTHAEPVPADASEPSSEPAWAA